MKILKWIIPYLDDIFFLLGLIAIITASFLVSAILGTYILGVAFLVVAVFAGTALHNPNLPMIIARFRGKK